ncbi:MAG: hypothetical protein ABI423_02375, partial [Burkholderiales bacterium]
QIINLAGAAMCDTERKAEPVRRTVTDADCRCYKKGEFLFASDAQISPSSPLRIWGNVAPLSRPGPVSLRVDLRAERALVARQWNASQESCVALAVAAAFTFHQARRDGEESLFESEYAGALDVAAAAIACLLPIYTLDGRGQHIPVRIDLARQRFRGGAAEVRCADGAILAPLAIVRRDLLPALLTIERSAIEFLAPRRQRPAVTAA